MTENPLVSVIIPVYNRANLIQRAIKSIVNQTYNNLEIIVVDDGSSDNTKEMVMQIDDSRIKYFRNEKNLGVSGARNKGIKLASGEIIVLQDSDDESYPDRIEKQLSKLLSCGEEVAAVTCGMEYYNSKTNQKIGKYLREADFKENFTKGSYFLTPSTGALMMKKSVFEEVGYFDEKMRAHVDTELGIRTSKLYKYAYVNELLVKVYHYHEQIKNKPEYYIQAKEIIYEKHKNYLSKRILYGLCKMIANFYILNNDLNKAKIFIKKSFQYRIEVKTTFQYILLSLFPNLLRKLYNKKYKGEIPLTSGLKPLNSISTAIEQH